MSEIEIFGTNIWPIVEWLAVGLNIIYVVLAAKEKKSCWYFGGVASALSIGLFFANDLPSEALLYIFYTAMAVVGYRAWSNTNTVLKITELSRRQHVIIIISGITLSGIFYAYSTLFSDASKPIIDALTTSFSIIATIMVVKKILSAWVYWIVIDIVTTYLYLSNGLYIYAGLMVIFTILAIFGFIKWAKEYRPNSFSNILDRNV